MGKVLCICQGKRLADERAGSTGGIERLRVRNVLENTPGCRLRRGYKAFCSLSQPVIGFVGWEYRYVAGVRSRLLYASATI